MDQAVRTASHEMGLLLACVRAAVGATTPRPHDALISERVDWDALLHLALCHGVMPQLHARLDAIAGGAVPPRTRQQLGDSFRANARANLYRAGQLLELLLLFDTEGIRAVPLKGPVLAEQAYGAVSMRQFSDLDVLVGVGDVPAVERILGARGYELRQRGETSAVWVRAAAGGRVAIDLQWALAEPRYRFPLNAIDVRSRLRRVPFLNASVWQPAAEDQLLLLCCHGAKHCWSRLAWVADIAAVLHVERECVDWPRLIARASQGGAERLLLLGLALAGDLAGARLPAVARAALDRDRMVTRLERELRQRLLESGPPQRLNGTYGFVEAGLLYIRTRERFRDKLPHALYTAQVLREWWTPVPNERDRAAVRLPRGLDFLYHVIRPVRLLHKYGGRAWQSTVQAITAWR